MPIRIPTKASLTPTVVLLPILVALGCTAVAERDSIAPSRLQIGVDANHARTEPNAKGHDRIVDL